MAKKTRKSNTKASAISDRSGFRFPMDEMVIEPGTGYLVHKSESDGAYNLVDHPANYPNRYARFDDPKPTIGGREEPTINAQNSWLGQGYTYLIFTASIGPNTPYVSKLGSGSSTITMTSSVAGSFQPGFGAGSSSIVLTTSTVGTTAEKLGSGSSSITISTANLVSIKSSLTGSFSSAFSSAYDRDGGSFIEFTGSGTSSLIMTTLNSFSFKGGVGFTGSGSSSMAMTTVCSVSIKSTPGSDAFSTAFSSAYG